MPAHYHREGEEGEGEGEEGEGEGGELIQQRCITDVMV